MHCRSSLAGGTEQVLSAVRSQALAIAPAIQRMIPLTPSEEVSRSLTTALVAAVLSAWIDIELLGLWCMLISHNVLLPKHIRHTLQHQQTPYARLTRKLLRDHSTHPHPPQALMGRKQEERQVKVARQSLEG